MKFHNFQYSFFFLFIFSCAKPQEKIERKQAVNKLLVAGRSTPDTYLSQPQLNLDSKKLWQHFSQIDPIQCAEKNLIEKAVSHIQIKGDLKPSEKFMTWVDDRFAVLVWRVERDGIEIRDAYVEATFYRKGDRCFLREIADHSLSSMNIVTKTAPVHDDFSGVTGSDFKLMSSRVIYFATNKGLQEAREWKASKDDEILTVTAVGLELEDVKEAFNNHFHAERTVYMEAYKDNYLEATPTRFIAPFLSMGDGLFTDGDGVIEDGNLVELRGERVTIVDPNGNVVQVQGEEQADGSLLVAMAPPLDSELHTYVGLNRMARFALRHLKTSDSSLLSRSIQVTPKRADANGCNAFYSSGGNPSTGFLVFFAQSALCVNTALLMDVIAHEWCHALHDATGQPGIQDSAASEGLADTCASYLLGRPEMARGFFIGNDAPIREVSTDRIYPGDVPADRQVHTEGLIIGSTFWSLREAMVEKYGPTQGAYVAEKLFFQHLLTTNTYLDAYRGVLRVDDDDGDPMTQSPNHCLITDVFLKHGLAEENDLPDGCDDSGIVTPIPVHDDLKVSMESKDDGILFHVAGAEVAEVVICAGEEVCEKKDGVLMITSGKKENLDFFLYEGDRLAPGSFVTFVTYGYYGDKKMKTMKVVSK